MSLNYNRANLARKVQNLHEENQSGVYFYMKNTQTFHPTNHTLRNLSHKNKITNKMFIAALLLLHKQKQKQGLVKWLKQ
jgi:hypothetical protein